jgi:hypothetical protein
MSSRRRCATCGKPLRGPVLGGRAYCGPSCWPSRRGDETEIERLRAIRDECLAAIEEGRSPVINTLAVRRLDELLAELSP